MILSLIRRLGRSALRSKWKAHDRREFLTISQEAIIQPPSRDDVVRELLSSYQDWPVPGYYVDARLATEVLSLIDFVVKIHPGTSPNLLGWWNTRQGSVPVFRKPEPPEPLPAENAPGYTVLTKS